MTAAGVESVHDTVRTTRRWRAYERETDEALLRATPDEPEAFGVFYRRHVDPVLAFFRARTDDPELAADLMAETFAAALIAAPRFKPRREPPVAWLFTIARRKLIDSWRRGRVEDGARRQLYLEPMELDDGGLARIEALIDQSRDPTPLVRLLDGLPEGQRQALCLRVLDERHYADIAGELQCSEAVVRKRVSRATRALRTLREDV
jgi:RNA polymerase sigma-70 factor (ECF subfamily)